MNSAETEEQYGPAIQLYNTFQTTLGYNSPSPKKIK